MQRAPPGGHAVMDAPGPAWPAAPPKSTSKKVRAITFVDFSPTVDASDKKRRRTDVRKHAATASAAARKATIARRTALRQEQAALHLRHHHYHHHHYHHHYLHYPEAAFIPPGPWQSVVSIQGAPPTAVPSHPTAYPFDQLVQFVTELEHDGVCLTGPVERTSLAHKAMRSTLLDAMTHSTTLFQAALFVAGTHSNTCGLPSHAIDLGVGLILLRGASIGAIHASIVASHDRSSGDGGAALVPVAIALLAGWERRFGDQQAFEVHMKAWRRLALPSRALDATHVSTLTDLVLESFRENLDERAETFASSSSPTTDEWSTCSSSAASSSLSPPSSSLVPSPSLPPIPLLPEGFTVFLPSARPETRSLLSLVARLCAIDPAAPRAIANLRRLGLENMAWSPTHTLGVEPRPAREAALPDQLHLHACYHVRAACIAVGGLLLHHAMRAHAVPWDWDVRAALGVHTVSCQHLRTDDLVGGGGDDHSDNGDVRTTTTTLLTSDDPSLPRSSPHSLAVTTNPYGSVAVWTRFVLCAAFRDPARDSQLRRWLRLVGVVTWSDLRNLLARFWYDERLIGDACWDLFRILKEQEQIDGETGTLKKEEEEVEGEVDRGVKRKVEPEG